MRLRKPNQSRNNAVTKIEVFVVVLVLGVIAILVLPKLARSKQKAARTNCISNVRQITLGTRMWGTDHEDRFPWQVSTNNGGTKELSDSTNVWPHWYVMRKEIESPRILTCPEDKERHPPSWIFTVQPTNETSYFLNFSALPETNDSILMGDRHLLLDGRRLQAGWHAIAANADLGWDRVIHPSLGNLGMSDGSTYQANKENLQRDFRNSPTATNRLLIP